MIYLIIASGAAQVGHAMLVVGLGLIPIAMFHLVPLICSALSWHQLLPAAGRPHRFAVVWIRWIRESINSLLPVASIGGDVASIRLAHLQGVPLAEAAASMVVDTTLGVVTQLIFVLSGVGLLLMRSNEPGALIVAVLVLIGIGTLLAAVAAFVFVQHRGLFAGFAKFVRGLLPENQHSTVASSASAIDSAVVAAYRSRSVIWRASILRLLGWAAGAGEVWLVTYALGHPIGILDAYILESLSSGVRAAAFILPGALGALEGSLVVFGALFGLPAHTALVISLSKRVRELALGLPGLLLWQWIEGRHLLRRVEPSPYPRPEKSPRAFVGTQPG